MGTHVITYIVRIYRREESDPDRFAGIVEEPGTGEHKAFTSTHELLNLLRQRKEIPATDTSFRRKPEASRPSDSRRKFERK